MEAAAMEDTSSSSSDSSSLSYTSGDEGDKHSDDGEEPFKRGAFSTPSAGGSASSPSDLASYYLFERSGLLQPGLGVPPPGWRTRDPIYSLLSPSNRHASSRGVGPPAPHPPLSDGFCVESALESVNSGDAVDMARAAFEAAAGAAIRAAMTVPQGIDGGGGPFPGGAGEDPTADADPRFVRVLRAIGSCRDQSFDATKNRFAGSMGGSKKKKKPASAHGAAASAALLSLDALESTSARIGDSPPLGPTSVTSAPPGGDELSPKLESPPKATKKDKKKTNFALEVTEYSLDSKGGSAASGQSRSSPDRPSPTSSSFLRPHPTPTASSSAAHSHPTSSSSSGGGGGGVDSRSTVSRAILCAAASVAFGELTPDYASTDGVQDERWKRVDPLDIPQNTHYTESGLGGSGGSDGRPVVNMGAVLMQAEVLGRRAISQAIGSARRSDRRMRWRLDSARRDLESRRRELHVVSDDETKEDGSAATVKVKTAVPLTLVAFTALPALANPFALTPTGATPLSITALKEDDEDEASFYRSQARPLVVSNEGNLTVQWSDVCLPHIRSVLASGPGHAILCDRKWRGRSGRIADLLLDMATLSSSDSSQPDFSENDHGPHLVVTTAFDLPDFETAFAPVRRGLPDPTEGDSPESGGAPRALLYSGSARHRRNLRLRYLLGGGPGRLCCSGLPESPFHVILTTYAALAEDYSHLCRIAFRCVVLDDGLSWLGVAHHDPNGNLGKVWESGIWSSSDGHTGGAGAGVGVGSGWYDSGPGDDGWDFGRLDGLDNCRRDGDGSEQSPDSKKTDNSKATAAGGLGMGSAIPSSSGSSGGRQPPLLIGLSARHRILLAPTLHASYRGAHYPAPVPALLSFLVPQFSDAVREEWDRSRIYNDSASMEHVRRLICRSITVHTGAGDYDDSESSSSDSSDEHGQELNDQFRLAMGVMSSSSSHFDDTMHGAAPIPRHIPTDDFIAEGKIVQSRRFASAWMRDDSPLRFELGNANLDPILEAVHLRAGSGHVCEEIVTASSTTSSGAGGTVSGPAAYRAAVRCGRTFGSEQGLRQHMAALHAPPGTWLCRTCGSDCGTSQARTHHERTCGTAPGSGSGGAGEGASGSSNTGGGIPTVGQGVGSKGGGKQAGGVAVGSSGGSATPKDKDGSLAVPGWRGVWVNPAGKHFIKIKGKRLTEDMPEGKSNDGGSSNKSNGPVQLFDSVEEAAKRFDRISKGRGLGSSSELNYREDGSRIVYEDSAAVAAAGRGLEMLGGGASSVVPALSVINIKDLPKHVKPLLRDPRQTSRTGGNSKRYVYAYRGVCRQARKGHDRWQSQISFGGTNHYLGTFDSEWDAAAIYAWAHLILYGEEATKKAQKEGEEAASAYEQEKKDIAAGKIVALPTKPSKKKKKKLPQSKKPKEEATSASPTLDPGKEGNKDPGGMAAQVKAHPKTVHSEQNLVKKAQMGQIQGFTTNDTSLKIMHSGVGVVMPSYVEMQPCLPKKSPLKKRPHEALMQQDSMTARFAPPVTLGLEEIGPLVPTSATQILRAPTLNKRKEYIERDDVFLLEAASVRILALRKSRIDQMSASDGKGDGTESVCLPISLTLAEANPPRGCAMLVGLSGENFGWDANYFLLSNQHTFGQPTSAFFSVLNEEYGYSGLNSSFCSVLLSSHCIIGRASIALEKASTDLGLGSCEVGSTVGDIDCNVGGVYGSCSDLAAEIAYVDTYTFQFRACNDEDVVTLNGRRITGNMGSFPLQNADICSVGARVFIFVLPQVDE